VHSIVPYLRALRNTLRGLHQDRTPKIISLPAETFHSIVTSRWLCKSVWQEHITKAYLNNWLIYWSENHIPLTIFRSYFSTPMRRKNLLRMHLLDVYFCHFLQIFFTFSVSFTLFIFPHFHLSSLQCSRSARFSYGSVFWTMEGLVLAVPFDPSKCIVGLNVLCKRDWCVVEMYPGWPKRSRDLAPFTLSTTPSPFTWGSGDSVYQQPGTRVDRILSPQRGFPSYK
jgi:hypothetical protein